VNIGREKWLSWGSYGPSYSQRKSWATEVTGIIWGGELIKTKQNTANDVNTLKAGWPAGPFAASQFVFLPRILCDTTPRSIYVTLYWREMRGRKSECPRGRPCTVSLWGRKDYCTTYDRYDTYVCAYVRAESSLPGILVVGPSRARMIRE
jgi:hypothetical protein